MPEIDKPNNRGVITAAEKAPEKLKQEQNGPSFSFFPPSLFLARFLSLVQVKHINTSKNHIFTEEFHIILC